MNIVKINPIYTSNNSIAIAVLLYYLLANTKLAFVNSILSTV